MDDKQPMRSEVDLDWVTFFCPCNAVYCTRHRSDVDIAAWLATHRVCTNGTIHEHTTDDGNRVWAQPEPDRTVPYPENRTVAKKSFPPSRDSVNVRRYIPQEFRTAIRKEPADKTAKLVLADWLDENDRPREAVAWRWLATTGLTPAAVSFATCAAVDKQLGISGPPYSIYLAGKAANHKSLRGATVYSWLSSGWDGTDFAGAQLHRAIRNLGVAPIAHCDPLVPLCSLL
jgi:uncharacterized protein (TIGR02996 family)